MQEPQEAQDSKERNPVPQRPTAVAGQNTWMGLVLLLGLAVMALRVWMPDNAALASPGAAVSPAPLQTWPATSLEQSLSLLGLTPLCARRAALRMPGRG